MRGSWLVILVLLGGCISSTGDRDDAAPGVSMDVQRTNQNGQVAVEATLTAVRGPIEDWSDLDVRGCQAPATGPIDIPHKFSACSWSFSIRHAPTGQVLYSV